MDKLYVERTKNSPEVLFDPMANEFSINGEARPENVRFFFDPILNWLDEFYKEQSELHKNESDTIGLMKVDVRLGYFNSSSAKFIFDILKRFHDFSALDIDVYANWYYDEGDDDMKQAGEDLSEMLDFPFKYIEETY